MNQLTHDDIGSSPPSGRRLLFSFQVALSLLTGGIALTQYAGPSAGQVDPHSLLFSSILFGYTFASMMFRFGWTIPCIVVATLWASFDTSVRGGSQISQLNIHVLRLQYAPLAGLLVGLIMDLLINPPPTNQSPNENQKAFDSDF